jgi:hypothetical protein
MARASSVVKLGGSRIQTIFSNSQESHIMNRNRSNHFLKLGVAFALLSGNVMANPTGVPVPPAPLTCSTANYTVTAVTGANGEFPVSVPCMLADGSQGTCSQYEYNVTSPTGLGADHAYFAASAEMDFVDSTPSATVGELGAGDSKTTFLKYAMHEYPLRMNENASTFDAQLRFAGQSSPRISTVLITSGKIYESCGIAGPGVPADHWAPRAVEETAIVAGGKCAIVKHYDGNGRLVSITLPPNSTCVVGQPADGQLMLNGVQLQNNDGHNGITFGSGTTTCYGPPTPKTPWCVCTAAPCPY